MNEPNGNQKNLRNLLRKPSALTNQFINQTGTFGPVMLRRMKKIN